MYVLRGWSVDFVTVFLSHFGISQLECEVSTVMRSLPENIHVKLSCYLSRQNIEIQTDTDELILSCLDNHFRLETCAKCPASGFNGILVRSWSGKESQIILLITRSQREPQSSDTTSLERNFALSHRLRSSEVERFGAQLSSAMGQKKSSRRRKIRCMLFRS